MCKKVELGSVSTATMRTEDLIPCFLEVLKELAPEHSAIKTVEENMAKYKTEEKYYASDDADYDLNEELFGALNELAPDYCYFGSHPGDGADYGFWVSWEGIEDDIASGEILRVSDLSEVPPDYTGYVAHVNDHGNITLYHTRIEFDEIWSAV